MRNCPVCGAENEEEARFCAECGTPLDAEDNDATIVGQVRVVPGPEEESEEDQPIVSTSFREIEEDETLTLDWAQAGVARAETPSTESTSPPPRPEMGVPPASVPRTPEKPVVEVPPPPPSPPSEGGPPAGTPRNNRPFIIGGIIAALLLCCCCCSFIVGSSLASNPELIEELMRELGVSLSYFLV